MKVKVIVQLEREGAEVPFYETTARYVFGYSDEACNEEQHISIAEAVLKEWHQAFHKGVRIEAGKRKIKIKPARGQ